MKVKESICLNPIIKRLIEWHHYGTDIADEALSHIPEEPLNLSLKAFHHLGNAEEIKQRGEPVVI